MRGVLACVFLLLISSLVSAAVVDVRYDIAQETVEYRFSNVTTPITTSLNGQEVQVTRNRVIQQPHASLDDIFSASLNQLNASIEEVLVYLPPQASLTSGLEDPNPSVHPRPTDIFTDGRRIILLWQGSDLAPANAILVEYEIPTPNYLLYVLLFVLAGGVAYLLRNKIGKDTDKYTRNLYENEKLLVELLLQAKNRELWQNELTKQSQLSKVTVSRKLQNLEKKGIIKKIPHGNTNRIRLVQDE